MKKHRPRIRKARHRNNCPQKAIVVAHGNGIEPVYYHGGAAWLKTGDYVYPRDQIFVTKHKLLATMCAFQQCGRVYRVEPEGMIEVDPQHGWGNAFRCERARIVAREHADFRLKQKISAWIADGSFAERIPIVPLPEAQSNGGKLDNL